MSEPDPTTNDAGAVIAAMQWADAELREFPLPDRRKPEQQTVIRQSVLNCIHKHGQTSLTAEVCGVLVGTLYRDDQSGFLLIDASIAGQDTGSNANHVTFTAETWTGIQTEMDATYPEKRIVGWYHTHPGFGVFLSEMDVFIHRGFFDLPWQVALVYDPCAKEDGLFAYRGDELLREDMLVEEDEPAVVNFDPPATLATPESELAARVRRLERRQWLLLALLLIFALLAFLWPIAMQTFYPALRFPLVK